MAKPVSPGLTLIAAPSPLSPSKLQLAQNVLATTLNRKRLREYQSWKHMRRRCNNPNDAAYPRYGGRGIKVCARWNDFALFLEDMGLCPDSMSIERRDNDGNYEPDNCYWATRTAQSRNRPGFVKLSPELAAAIRSETGKQRDIAAKYGVCQRTVNMVLRGVTWLCN